MPMTEARDIAMPPRSVSQSPTPTVVSMLIPPLGNSSPVLEMSEMSTIAIKTTSTPATVPMIAAVSDS